MKSSIKKNKSEKSICARAVAQICSTIVGDYFPSFKLELDLSHFDAVKTFLSC